MRFVGKYGVQIIRWADLKEAVRQRDGIIAAQAKAIKDKTIELYRVRAELNRLRNHHDRLHPTGDR